ncbi:MAG TPA: hypothetical protein VL749_10150 [Patescibacteria group bacterium]|nr:hypothetical protein [Patescibacteria group bacterium]
MNRSLDVDVVLREYLADDGLTAPDRVLDVVEKRIGGLRQRHAWRLRGRLLLNTQLKLVAGLAAVIVLALAGYSLLPNSGIGGQASATPEATPVATPAGGPPGSPDAYVCEEGTGCAGLLAAGDGRTRQFSVPFTYTTPAGWMNPIDLPTLVALTPVDQPADLILVWSGAAPAEDTATCTLQAKPGASATVSGWMAYLDSHPGLDARNPQTLSIAQHPARSMDVRSFGGWTSPCASDRADFNVPLIKTPGAAPGDGYGVRIGAQARIYAIAVASQTVIVTVYAYGDSDATLAAATDLAKPVVESFFFAAP